MGKNCNHNNLSENSVVEFLADIITFTRNFTFFVVVLGDVEGIQEIIIIVNKYVS